MSSHYQTNKGKAFDWNLKFKNERIYSNNSNYNYKYFYYTIAMCFCIQYTISGQTLNNVLNESMNSIVK